MRQNGHSSSGFGAVPRSKAGVMMGLRERLGLRGQVALLGHEPERPISSTLGVAWEL